MLLVRWWRRAVFNHPQTSLTSLYSALPRRSPSMSAPVTTAVLTLNLAMPLLFLLLLLGQPGNSDRQPLPLWAAQGRRSAGVYPPTCCRIECPGFGVVDAGDGYEVRRYNATAWASTASVEDISLVAATRSGFLKLFDYIEGKNEYSEKIEMTAPVITQVFPSDGPICASSFIVSFYVPKKNQANPPSAEGLHIQRWGTKLVAVRQFGGFVSDYNVAEEAAALYASLAGSKWSSAIDNGRTADPASAYTVAQYNSPFEFSGRVNEIWMFLDADEGSSSL